ncbi:hypothetical protein V6N12_074786 [Hibiscus sabdariffa]
MATEEVRTTVVQWPRWLHGGRLMELAWIQWRARIERVGSVGGCCWSQLCAWGVRELARGPQPRGVC